jgi:hypothetical protein
VLQIGKAKDLSAPLRMIRHINCLLNCGTVCVFLCGLGSRLIRVSHAGPSKVREKSRTDGGEWVIQPATQWKPPAQTNRISSQTQQYATAINYRPSHRLNLCSISLLKRKLVVGGGGGGSSCHVRCAVTMETWSKFPDRFSCLQSGNLRGKKKLRVRNEICSILIWAPIVY